jgi:hypothetical protein
MPKIGPLSYPTIRKLSDPAPPGKVKLRIRANGDPQDTRVYAVDADGFEHEVVGVIAASWAMPSLNDVTQATITVCESDVELDAEPVTIAARCRACYDGTCRKHGRTP